VRRLFHPLDRYVFSEFWKIFTSFALGFPLLVIVIDLTDNLDKFLNRRLTPGQIALSYVYGMPETMFQVLPAAVLFATVFTIGAITRHSEITAAKASGISFYRIIGPIFVGAIIATGLGVTLGELSPRWNLKRLTLQQDKRAVGNQERYNFAHASESGRVYKATQLDARQRTITALEIERKGTGPRFPTLLTAARTADWTPQAGWLLRDGALHVLPNDTLDIAFVFDSLRDRQMLERPRDLLATPRAPPEMNIRELGRFIRVMERSGADVNELRVERMLRVTIPMTCIVILLFGAPLATSTQRGGAAYGVGISLGTTVVFLMLIQLTKAIGGKGLISPELAAWLPSMLFGVVGLILFARVRT
jgi:lipopolysaccharide export system permease protein